MPEGASFVEPADVLKIAFAMPLMSPSFARGSCRYTNSTESSTGFGGRYSGAAQHTPVKLNGNPGAYRFADWARASSGHRKLGEGEAP
jgi:acetoacetate decarboxylase